MSSIVPIAKALYLCDEVLADRASGKPHLLGILNSIRPPSFPHVLPRLCVFAQLIGGHGEGRCRVRIVAARNLDAVYESSDQVIRFDDRLETKYYTLRLRQITLHGPGEYWVELMWNGRFVDDAVLRVFP
jgi:hypothetical protein